MKIEEITVYEFMPEKENTHLNILVDLTTGKYEVDDFSMEDIQKMSLLGRVEYFEDYSKWYKEVMEATEQLIKKLCG